MRKDQNILDEGMFKGGSTLGWNDEEMLWVGQPKPLLDIIKSGLNEAWVSSQTVDLKTYSFGIVLLLGFFGVVEMVVLFGLCVIGFFLFSCVSFFFEGFFKSKIIRYGISETDVYFEMKYLWSRPFVNLLKIEDIDKVYFERNGNSTFNLHLVTRIDPGFSTYDLEGGEKRPFPTLEFLAKPQRPLQLLNERIRSRKRK